ncbi:MAG: lipocalin-like domain-containing protein [Desulfobacterales bacterium]
MKRYSKDIALILLILFMISTVTGHHAIAEDGGGFLSVTGPCNLVFPKDHGPHPGYRTEWWYYTGNLQSDAGTPYGFQLTFFRRQISPPDAHKKWPEPHSAWRTQQIYIGHAAISDISKKRHLSSERIAREALGMAGVSQEANATTVFIKNWSAKIGTGSHLLKAATDDFSYKLTLRSLKPLVLHGAAGYSRKGSSAERASCYYSFTRLMAEGTLTLDGKTIPVKGLGWMDHEFSTAPLEPGIIGWDWFGLQLSDKSEIMLFALRNENGGLHPASSGTFINPSGRRQHLIRENFSVEILDQWESPRSGAVYPVRWRVDVFPLAIQLSVAANMVNQEMQTPGSTGQTYWEGSVATSGSVGNRAIQGQGYVELTGYAKFFSPPM